MAHPLSIEIDMPGPSQRSRAPVAEVDDLSVTFRRGGRDIHALRGVSLDVRPGEILGLVGESGSGKSVLGACLLGLLPASPPPRTGGRVLVHGRDMLHGDPEAHRLLRRDHLGAVFQDPMTSLNPTMRIGRQVAEAAGDAEQALRLLEAVGVPEASRRMDAYPHELSGGLRQRVMIAMAVAGSPSLVVADEPTTALDVTVQAQVLALVRRLRDEIGASFVLITHDLGVAAQVADRVAVLYAGRLAEVGAAATILHAAAHPYSVGLMRSRLSLSSPRDRRLATLPGEVPNPAAPPPGCAFAPRCELASDACTAGQPPLVPITPGHHRACVAPPPAVAALARDPVPDPVAVPVSPDPRPASRPTVARVHDVTRVFPVRHGRLRALRGVDLEVGAGESVAVVGESGSGKSTLLRLVAGLDHPTAGQVVRSGRPQMVFQDAAASLTPWLTVGSIIGERLRGRPRAQRQAQVAAALARVGLPAEVAEAKAGQLSGGQCQRVALARAIAEPPPLLLCDEPTSAQDVSLAASIVNLIGDLRRELGMAVMFVTHDLSVARIVADRIAVMYLGRIVEVGPAEDVVARPRHPYTKALVAAVPDVGVEPAALPGEPASPVHPPAGCAFHPRCPLAEGVCSDPDFDPRLVGLPDEPGRFVACLLAGRESR
jgi:peptide/nickel transport system ATP-binding protein